MLLAGYLVNLGLVAFSGFGSVQGIGSYFWDALVAMGIGAVASIVTLYVAGVIGSGLTPELAIKIVALETVPTGMGASVALNQHSGGDSHRRGDDLRLSTDVTVILGSLLGGVLFSFNIAPTMEPELVTLQQDWWQTLATMLLSIGVAYMIVHIAQFEERDLSERTVVTSRGFEASLSYVIALFVAALLLLGFGYINFGDPLSVWVPRVVTAAYVTAVGGAAGRLVL